MIDHIWTVLCGQAIQDAETNIVSLLNIVEELNIAGTPNPTGFARLPMELVSLWERRNSDAPTHGTEQVIVRNPEGGELGSFEAEIKLTEAIRCRSRLKMSGMPLPVAGRYVFEISVREDSQEPWRQVATIPLYVTFCPRDDQSGDGGVMGTY